MKKIQKKYVRNYYAIAILINVVLPVLSMIYVIGNRKGEAQMGYFIIGIWGLICIFVYSIYFAIPDFNKNWEKVAGLLFPTILLSLALIKYWNFALVILLNLIMNGFFIWHLTKKTFHNNVYN